MSISFHFLERHQNLYQQRPTPCPCSHDAIINPPNPEDTSYSIFRKHVHPYSSCTSKQSEEKFKTSHKGLYHTQEDHVRRTRSAEKRLLGLRVFIYIFTHVFTYLFTHLFTHLFIYYPLML